jgi:Ca-activated chloride channel family protein
MKTNRSSRASNESTPPRPIYGLHALGLTFERVALPLKVIDARFEVAGGCAEVAIEQIFEFDGPNPVDVLYTFPLPEEASVYRCTMSIGGRKVVAVVKTLDEAREDFKRAHNRGHRAALVESVRDNLFELQLGNVQPGDQITISLAFVCALQTAGPQKRLRIPVCPGVRFIPGTPVGVDGGTGIVPDAARLLPQRIGAEHPDAVAFFCSGTILHARELDSPSHDIDWSANPKTGRVEVMFREDSEIPDRDFILTWAQPCETLALMGAEDQEHLMCSFQTPADLGVARGPRDVFILLDASGSMLGRNWIAVVEAVELALAGLRGDDRFCVTLFSNQCTPVTEGLVAKDEPAIRDVIDRLRHHMPSGGTQFTMAFDQTIRIAKKAKRPVILVITDGQFGDEARACAVARDCGIEVHAVGIDANVNEMALRRIARRTRGTCVLATPGEELDQVIRELMENLLCPMIDRISAGPDWELVGNPPPLRPGRAALLSLCRTDQSRSRPLPGEVELEMVFTDGSRRKETLGLLQARGIAPAILAAKARITAHLDEDEKDKAVELACRYNIVCDGAAFIAIDELERVPVAKLVLEQPSHEPEDQSAILGTVLACRVEAFASDYAAPRASRKRTIPNAMNLNVHAVRDPARALMRNQNYWSEAAAWLLDIASRVSCFNRDEWMKLMNDHLIPWAMTRDSLVRLEEIERLVCWLEGLPAEGWNTMEIVDRFEPLLRMLDGKALKQTSDFLHQFKNPKSKKPG